MVRKETIEVNGKLYELQHPGAREWLKLKQEVFALGTGGHMSIDIVKLLDYCFEHVVFPSEGPKLSVDTDSMEFIEEVEEVWSVVLPQFLRGNTVLESYTTSGGATKTS